jgi:prepilin-type N-terminal cleavage/methylation domain-containing protein
MKHHSKGQLFSTKRRKSQYGFTLIEILVVLVIVAMISGVVMTGLAQVFNIKERLGPLIDQSDEAALVGSWYRGLVRGVAPDYKGSKSVFAGGPASFSGLSLMSIGGETGSPTQFNLAIVEIERGRWALHFSEETGKSDFDLVTWRADEKGAEDTGFQYFDGKEWSRVWPVPDRPDARRSTLGPGSLFVPEDPPQIPKLIRALVIAGGQKMVLVAAPRGPERPTLRLQDLLR